MVIEWAGDDYRPIIALATIIALLIADGVALRKAYLSFSCQPLWPAGPSLRMKMGGPGDTTGVGRKPYEYSVVKDLAANASNTLRRREIGAYLKRGG